MSMQLTLSEAIDLVLSDVSDEARRSQMKEELERLFAAQAQAGAGKRILESNIEEWWSAEGPGGQAYILSDLLCVGDLIEVAEGASEDFSPISLIKLLYRTVVFWGELRGIRVPLSPREFKVMKAIKRGEKDVSVIAQGCGLTESEVRATVGGLQSRQYRSQFSLVEGADGNLTTRF